MITLNTYLISIRVVDGVLCTALPTHKIGLRNKSLIIFACYMKFIAFHSLFPVFISSTTLISCRKSALLLCLLFQ